VKCLHGEVGDRELGGGGRWRSPNTLPWLEPKNEGGPGDSNMGGHFVGVFSSWGFRAKVAEHYGAGGGGGKKERVTFWPGGKKDKVENQKGGTSIQASTLCKRGMVLVPKKGEKNKSQKGKKKVRKRRGKKGVMQARGVKIKQMVKNSEKNKSKRGG